MNNLIGRKVRGFKFQNVNIIYSKSMNKCIGKIGVITHVFDNSVIVYFRNVSWRYPLDQIEQHLVEEEPKETIEQRIKRLEKELEEAKKERKEKVWILVWRRRNGALYIHTNRAKPIIEIGCSDEGVTLIDIIEREY